jgi:ATP-binding cassette subfamily B protein/subfamily B ATP-binding cassette protein MsbA
VFDALAEGAVRANRGAAVVESAYGAVNGIFITVGMAVVLYAGGQRVLAHELSLGSLLVFIAYLRTLETASRGLLTAYGKLRAAEASIERVLELMDATEAVEDRSGARPLPERPAGGRGHLVFERVSFGYEPDRPVLQAISFELMPGETLALVGATGAGKSTLASLVPRFFDPLEGRILLDGMDLREIRLAALRAQVSVVLQESFLLPLTVGENIAYGCEGASRDEIVAAAVAANAHEFIRRLPQGYDTVLGEQGATLSGGERQRLAIARAVLKDARVLILDEPTSALDASTEQLVVEALQRLVASRTTLIIAHRLSTVRRANRIAVLEHGRLVEIGGHAELVAAGGRYAQLHALQAI